MNRNLLMHILLFNTLIFNGISNTFSSDSTEAQDHLIQFDELEAQITTRNRSLEKKAISSQAEWILNTHALIHPTDGDPLDVVLRRTGALIDDLQRHLTAPQAKKYVSRLSALKTSAQKTGLAKSAGGATAASYKELYLQASALRREVALANPEIDFDMILFAGVVKPGGEYHMCDQYFGWNARNGGGLFLLTGIKSGEPVVKNLLENVKVASGKFAGKTLANGAVLSPDLSYDGTTVLFAWTTQTDKCYHIFKINIDGTGLVQLTDGTAPDNGRAEASHNDFDPCWLPNGRIAFISERRGGYGRCHPRNVPTYTLYSMKSDGSDIICLSFHETNEWHPSVDNQGQIVYTRWDYLDRDDCIAHHLWHCGLDGTNPRAPHGNYPLPQSTMQGASWSDGRAFRPNGEWNIRAIPGSDNYIATASGHHTHSFGQLVMIDINIRDDNKMSQIKGITTSQTRWSDAAGPYGTAWPLSEKYYLCNYNSQIVLLDQYGNREALYTNSSGSFRPLDPIPVRPRTMPPAANMKTWQGERHGKSGHNRATLSIMNVYNSDLPLGSARIKAMRIIQVFPQFTPRINQPRIGYASESLARMALGTVPVEPDGSVYCEAPVGKEVYFQLLDDQNRAVHSMRAGAYVHPGEQLTCLGCHEDKWSAPPSSGMPSAFARAPSKLTPEAGGLEPVNFHRLVKPLFTEHCTPCHKQKGKGPDMSYKSLANYAFWWPGPGNPYVNGDITTAKHGGSRTIPGKFGAIASTLLKHLDASHNNVSLSQDELRRITLWLDCNSNELGAYTKVSDQQSGKLVWPELDCDPVNPTGVESDRPLASDTDVRNRFSPWLKKAGSSIPKAFFSAERMTLTVQNLPAVNNCNIQLFNAAGRPLFHVRRAIVSGNSVMVRMPPVSAGFIIAQLVYDGGRVSLPLIRTECMRIRE